MTKKHSTSTPPPAAFCQRTPYQPPFTKDNLVIRFNETDETKTGHFWSYQTDRKFALVIWDGGVTDEVVEPTPHPVQNLRLLEDWKAAQKNQKRLKDYWG